MRRNHDQRHRRMDAAQRDQAGEAAGARHRQVEQHQIDILIGHDQRLGAFEIAGLVDGGDIADAGKCLAQRTAKQRMIVGDDERIA